VTFIAHLYGWTHVNNKRHGCGETGWGIDDGALQGERNEYQLIFSCASARISDWGVEVNGAEADESAFDIPFMRFDRTRAIKVARELSKIDDARSAITLILQYVLIVGAAALAVWSHHRLVYIVACLFIGTRIQVLGIIFHEATHNLLFSKRWVNDLIGDIFIGFPMGFSVALFRSSHVKHHRKTNTFEDPDFVFMTNDGDQHFPKSRLDFALLLVRSAVCINLLRWWWFARRYSPAVNFLTPLTSAFPLHARVIYAIWLVAVVSLIHWTHSLSYVLVFFAVPGVVWANFVNRVRSMAEHGGVAMTKGPDATRTVIPSWLDRLIVAPVGVSYHIEHHLFPFVPGHRLAELHRALMKDEAYRKDAHVTHSYWGVFRDMTTAASRRGLASPSQLAAT
jgi:fatty acid desaturase